MCIAVLPEYPCKTELHCTASLHISPYHGDIHHERGACVVPSTRRSLGDASALHELDGSRNIVRNAGHVDIQCAH